MNHPYDGARPTVAVVGAGVSGLTAAHVLRRAHDVTLFEADDRLGGHAHTHELAGSDGAVRGVDSGFIVHNTRTYPTLLRLFAELGVTTQDADMSMSVRCDGCGLEYAGARRGPGLFPQASNLARPAYLRMLGEVVRFHRHARRLLTTADADADAVTLGSFLAIGGYSRYFVDHFMVPMVAAVWSAGAAVSLRYPARYLFTFLAHHGMLGIGGSPQWRTVTGGSQRYVERIVKNLHVVRTGTAVRALRRTAGGVEVHDAAGASRRFDKVVVATHPDQALALLADPTADETAVLGAFSYSHNETRLHSDVTVLPRRAGARASWNYLKPTCTADDTAGVLVSYDMNRLQRLDFADPYVVTLGGADRIDETRVIAKMSYEHPIYTPESVAAQRRLPELTTAVTAYAGAYHGWGFHEDGAASGVRAAAALGVTW
ncbi:NAD(P)/FAD-dependent oxidoreductase [Pseudonocardia benzenivorans]|uniref:NAD(P)/FAD-dependent oxidoreductase n=1 Tax=Pseudonocardia benzenivorans TaxID=228005 RepID=A0ABW3VEQ5_9PSEU